jgi:aminomethyltransferase
MEIESAPLRRTPLHALHLELGARMVGFAGYDMPVQYPAGIIKEHLHTRSRAGLFDASHMGQVRLSGEAAAIALETLVPADIVGLAPGRQRYAFFTNEAGGLLDDLMVTNARDHLFLVVNASRKAEDIAHLKRTIVTRCAVEPLADRGLLALQGPSSAEVMQRLCPEAVALSFMSAAQVAIAGVPCWVSRSGYTGEDGFEISMRAGEAESIARFLLAQPEVAPAGLGARDSLRLEAGLCLYGHDIDEGTSPVEAGLAWAVGRERRTRGARAGGFPGAETILRQLDAGTTRTRVGLLPDGRAPLRDGEALFDGAGNSAGRITSGGFGPSVDGPIAMAYVSASAAAVGNVLHATVRGKPRACRIARLPFVAHRYHKART